MRVFRCPFSCLRCVPAGAEVLAQRELLLKALFGAVCIHVAVTIANTSFYALIIDRALQRCLARRE